MNISLLAFFNKKKLAKNGLWAHFAILAPTQNKPFLLSYFEDWFRCKSQWFFWWAAYVMRYFFGVMCMHFWYLWWCLAVGAITIVQCIFGALFLGLGCNIFLCCVFGAMHCQLYRAGLLPQWRIYFIIIIIPRWPTHCHPVLKREEVIFHFDRKQMFALHWRDAVESKIVVFHKHWTKLNVNGHALECNNNIKI